MLVSVERLDSRNVYTNAWMTVREDRVRYADGSTGIYGVVDKRDFTIVLPRTSTGFWLVGQFRYPIGRRALEFPQGGWPQGKDGPREELARTELIEETGLRAESLTHLGHLYGAYGLTSQGFDVFLATDLTEGEHRREHTEQDMVHAHYTDDEIRRLIVDGSIVDANSIAALWLYECVLDQTEAGSESTTSEPTVR